ncbi:Fpg/Nei family DNA glycosylase [Pseudarthrobacter sp. J1738]|uniref:Fpg/Nei family DNA glycosylase n=1 Tax=unclassified Pseudarthrobacter TaxID=2647000 RepID=UPI003D2DD331
MPEGHSVRRLAIQFADVFAGEQLAASSPQGRFKDGARLLDGQRLVDAQAHGKQLFLGFENQLVLHVHLGLYGAWEFGGDATFSGASSIGAPRKIGESESFEDTSSAPYKGPPEPRGAIRVRLVSEHGWADLRGASRCDVITEPEASERRAKLGPDPLHSQTGLHGQTGDEQRFVGGLRRRRTAVGQLLMDQSVVAGIGNIYRAELLFRAGINPFVPGTEVSESAASALWADATRLMSDGVKDGRIITTPPDFWSPELLAVDGLAAPEDSHFVYKRIGLPCRKCGTAVALTEAAARKLYWCPSCQH